MPNDRDRLAIDFRLKRFQRGTEYSLLVTIFAYYLMAFQGWYQLPLALFAGGLMFGMNFHLTQLRERRRTAAPENRARILADTLESVLFMVFVGGSLGFGFIWRSERFTEQEMYAYMAAVLIGMFAAGMTGEIFWQHRNFRKLSVEQRVHYIINLRRTIILPYTNSRQKAR
ncbi:MAG: hypothetical protein K1X90_11135 [Candidatus Kapabacteria bacterium]|nr:hypothetical protein [Candidatus Kapabacteria bacterium]